MSHIVTIRTEVRDVAALQAACTRLHLPPAEHKTARLFAGEATGHVVQLPGWRYPIVCETTTGQVQYDHFEGRWGAPAELDRFLQAYAVSKTLIEARRKGYACHEQPLPDGSIKLTLQMPGGAG